LPNSSPLPRKSAPDASAFWAQIEAATPWAQLVAGIEPHDSKGSPGCLPIGLERLIDATAQVCGIGVERLGGAFEDEVDKDTLRVVPTLLSHFLVFFTLQQLAVEQAEVAAPRAKFGHLVASEFDELRDLIARFGDTDLHRLFEEAAEVFWSPNATPAWKMHYLHLAQQRLRKLVDARHASAIDGLPIRGAKKIAPDTFSLTPLRGAGADAAGFVLRPGHG